MRYEMVAEELDNRKELPEEFAQGIIGYAKLFVVCLVVVMLTIATRFALRNVVYERMGICEPWMEILLGGDLEFSGVLEDVASREQAVSIDWEAQYPFSGINRDSVAKVSDTWWNAFQSRLERYAAVVRSVEEKIEFYCEDSLVFYNKAVEVASKLEQSAGMEASANGDVWQMKNGYLTYTEPECTDEEIQDDGLDWYDSYYVTDHHWKTETGFWAAGRLYENPSCIRNTVFFADSDTVN